jgi:hypothetical protein
MHEEEATTTAKPFDKKDLVQHAIWRRCEFGLRKCLHRCEFCNMVPREEVLLFLVRRDEKLRKLRNLSLLLDRPCCRQEAVLQVELLAECGFWTSMKKERGGISGCR